MVYPPREDSELLKKYLKLYARGKVLDMGTGSGIQAISAAEKNEVFSVLAVDIDKETLILKHKKIKFLHSDLFGNVKPQKFDTILFNAPYLPYDPKEDKKTALAVCGGRNGYEIFERFFSQASNYLAPDGIMLIIFSSLTNKPGVESIIIHNGFVFEQLESARFFMETVYCYKIVWHPALKELMGKGVFNITYFSKGKRGLIFTANYGKKKVAIKLANPKSQAGERINIESMWLKKLNPHGIGPKFVMSGNNYVVYEFAEGKLIKDVNDRLEDVCLQVLAECFTLDKLGINKEEMHHPDKHVVVGKNVTLIDFERAHYTSKPKNVTQFLEFMRRRLGIVIDKTIISGYKKNIKLLIAH